MEEREMGNDVIISRKIKKGIEKRISTLEEFQGLLSALCVMFGYKDAGSREDVDCRLLILDH